MPLRWSLKSELGEASQSVTVHHHHHHHALRYIIIIIIIVVVCGADVCVCVMSAVAHIPTTTKSE